VNPEYKRMLEGPGITLLGPATTTYQAKRGRKVDLDLHRGGKVKQLNVQDGQHDT
jgi:hypothetical protein